MMSSVPFQQEITNVQNFLTKHGIVLGCVPDGVLAALRAHVKAAQEKSQQANAILIEGMIFLGLDQKVKANREKMLKAQNDKIMGKDGPPETMIHPAFLKACKDSS